jgi:uncharacterized protein
MAIHIIPIDRLSPQALRGVIEEFILREGTNYGEKEVSLEASFGRVKRRLQEGSAVLVFDDEAETTNIFPADNPVVEKIRALAE